MVNTIDRYTGTRPIFGASNALFDIQASGRWTITITPIQTTSRIAISGTGDAISGLFNPPTTGAWKFSHNGTSNFVIRLHCGGGSDLITNDIGPVSGSTVIPFPKGPCMWEIKADGAWSLTPRS